jgi:hypothetical protein
MPRPPIVRHEMRCSFCSRSPLLAMYGIDFDGRLFIHVRVYKQRRIFAEMMYKGGEVSIVCRECLRWHRITIRDSVPALEEVEKPVELKASYSRQPVV